MLPVNRKGITLIEVLVVIAIVGVLVGLIIPAVQLIREVAARTKCQNNLRQVGLAFQNYHAHNGYFQASVIYNHTHPPKRKDQMEHGWAAFLLSDLGQEGLASEYHLMHGELPGRWFDKENREAVTMPISVLQCPSAEPNRVTQYHNWPVPKEVRSLRIPMAVMDYAVINAVKPDLVDLHLIDPPNNYDGALQWNMKRKVTDIGDGSSNTLLLTEDAGRPQLWFVGHPAAPAPVDDSDPGTPHGSGEWAAPRADIRFLNGTDYETGLARAGECAINCTNAAETYSFHRGGANALFADGSARFLNAQIGIQVFASLVTANGGEVVNGDR